MYQRFCGCYYCFTFSVIILYNAFVCLKYASSNVIDDLMLYYIRKLECSNTFCSFLFGQAKESGQLQNKWLMVNIQNVQDFACQCLNRDVWSNEAVKTIIREHFIFWQVQGSGGVKVLQASVNTCTMFFLLKLDALPHVTMLWYFTFLQICSSEMKARLIFFSIYNIATSDIAFTRLACMQN